MMFRLRLIAPVAAVLLVAFPAAHAAPAAKAPAPAARTAPAAHGALANDRQKLSYAIGVKLGTDLGGMLGSIKGDVDQPTVLKAINATMSHGATELTVPEAQAQLQAFDQLMQARQAAAQAKKPAPVHTASAADKHKLSYALGMKLGNDLGRMMEASKADVDQDVVMRAFNTVATGGASELPPEQAQAQLDAYGKRMQARQQADQVKMQAQATAAGKKNLADGAAFLAANGKKPGVKTTASGLEYMVEKQGTGPKPSPSDTVKVNYTGTLLDGSVFDSTAKHGGAPATFTVGGVIPGWTEALQLMNVGSKYVLWVPAKLGYGSDPSGPGGANSMLKFEVELLSIEKK